MSEQKLIIISGSPCVGKTTAAESLLYAYENSAHLDDDWVWRVHPFSFSDPRNQIGLQNMSYMLSSYLHAGFDYVIFSSVRVIDKAGRESVLQNITAKNYKIIGFTLTCSEETLTQRHQKRDGNDEVSFQWLRLEPHPNDHVIHTDNKTVMQIVEEMKKIIG